MWFLSPKSLFGLEVIFFNHQVHTYKNFLKYFSAFSNNSLKDNSYHEHSRGKEDLVLEQKFRKFSKVMPRVVKSSCEEAGEKKQIWLISETSFVAI